jgi:hypothetical protein
MIKLSDKNRKILKMIYRGVGVAAASLIFEACYGPLMPNEAMGMYGPGPEQGIDVCIRGIVKSKKTGLPVPGINVSIQGLELYERTDKEGRFYIWLDWQERYTLIFNDVDGQYNGGLFKRLEMVLDNNEINYELKIGLDEDEGEDASENELDEIAE